MREKGFTDLKTVEVLCRQHEVDRKNKEHSFQSLMHCAANTLHPVGKRQRQKGKYKLNQKRQRKRMNTGAKEEAEILGTEEKMQIEEDQDEKDNQDEMEENQENEDDDDDDIELTIRTEGMMRSHTSYLTFASFLPLDLFPQ